MVKIRMNLSCKVWAVECRAEMWSLAPTVSARPGGWWLLLLAMAPGASLTAQRPGKLGVNLLSQKHWGSLLLHNINPCVTMLPSRLSILPAPHRWSHWVITQVQTTRGRSHYSSIFSHSSVVWEYANTESILTFQAHFDKSILNFSNSHICMN